MTRIATVDERERIRATRVEIARLLALPYREKLTPDEYSMRNHLLFEHIKTLPLADREEFEEHILKPHEAMDWTLLEKPAVQRAIRSAARRVAAQYTEKLSATEEDLTQSGRLIVAENAHLARKAFNKGYLHRWVWQRLVDLIRYEHRDTSLDALEDARTRAEAIGDVDDSAVDLIWKGEPYWKGKWR